MLLRRMSTLFKTNIFRWTRDYLLPIWRLFLVQRSLLSGVPCLVLALIALRSDFRLVPLCYAIAPPRPSPFRTIPRGSARSLTCLYRSLETSSLLFRARADRFPRMLPSGGRTSQSRSPGSLASIEQFWS